MKDYYDCADNRVLKLFTMLFPVYKDNIVNYYSIGDMETIFHLENGSKVIFDELYKTAKYIESRPNTLTELSEKEWLHEFSRKLQRRLSLLNLTKKELGLRIGMPTSTMYRYVNGEKAPDIFIIKKIAKALNRDFIEFTDFDYLL